MGGMGGLGMGYGGMGYGGMGMGMYGGMNGMYGNIVQILIPLYLYFRIWRILKSSMLVSFFCASELVFLFVLSARIL